MEFKGQYLNFEDYTSLGGTLTDEAPFNLLEFEARRLINLYTFNRLLDAKYEDIPMEVKICDYELINQLLLYSNSQNSISSNSGVSSENIDGYSVSYITAGQVQEIVNSKRSSLQYTIRTGLLGVDYNGENLLYCGADD